MLLPPLFPPILLLAVILCESYWRAAALVLVGVVCKLAAQTCIHLAFGMPIWLFY